MAKMSVNELKLELSNILLDLIGLKAEVEKSIQTYSLSIDKEAKFK